MHTIHKNYMCKCKKTSLSICFSRKKQKKTDAVLRKKTPPLLFFVHLHKYR